MDMEEPRSLFFPPEFVPAVSHPLVEDRGPEVRHRVLVHSLYQYLHFTTVLEQVAIVPVTARISSNRSGVEAPKAMLADAFKITTDEAWHAQFSYDFIEEVERCSGVTATAMVEPNFVCLLDSIREVYTPGTGRALDLVAATVSETLVSSLLSEIPNDARLPGPVRALVADHAADEGRHHAYFRNFLRYLWPQLPKREQRTIGPRIPELVSAFLRPDLRAVAATLSASGFTQPETAEILGDCYPARSDAHGIRHAARSTVRSFREVGALDDLATNEAFLAAGLLAEPEASLGGCAADAGPPGSRRANG
ncbi:diiron oxygenase [Nocardia sp. NPDC049190]|uniref:diiron oxygenase n=1 Tax=Nocardia sp. NPDC049190 TaxID=3155650 RepID=UPI0033FD9AD5